LKEVIFSEHPEAKLLGFPPEAEKFCRGHKRVLPLEQNERLRKITSEIKLQQF